jgi:hypothetical protein
MHFFAVTIDTLTVSEAAKAVDAVAAGDERAVILDSWCDDL